MKTTKHVITLKVQGEMIKFTAHTIKCKYEGIKILQLNLGSIVNKPLDVSTILFNEELMKSAMEQVNIDYLQVAKALTEEQKENNLLADILEKEIKPCES